LISRGFRVLGVLVGVGMMWGWMAVSDAKAKEPAYVDFKVEDMPWVDNRQIALYLYGSSDVYSSSDRSSYGDYGSTLYQSGTSGYSNASINLSPNLKWLDITLDRELEIDTNLSLDYNYYTGTDNWETFYATSTTLGDDRYDSRNTNLAVFPRVRYDKYFPENYYISSTFSAELNGRLQSNVSAVSVGGGDSSSNGYEARYSLDPTLELEAGMGRLYDGAPAYEAMQIAADLQQAGKLLKPVLAEDMKRLSTLIAQNRQRIFLDSREKTRAAIEALVRFLAVNQYLKIEDPGAILVVDDTYRYLGNEEREFGMRLALATQVGYYFLRIQDKTDYLNNGFSSQDLAEVRSLRRFWTLGPIWNYAQPLGRQWQFNSQATAAYSPIQMEEYYLNSVQTVSRTGMKLLIPSANATLTYFHNTRWTARLTYELQSDLEDIDSMVIYGSQPLQEKYRLWTFSNSLSLFSEYNLTYDLQLFASISGAVTVLRDVQHRFEGDYAASPFDILPTDKAHLIQNFKNGAPAYDWSMRLGLRYQAF